MVCIRLTARCPLERSFSCIDNWYNATYHHRTYLSTAFTMQKMQLRHYLSVVLSMAGFPILFYGIIFALLTYPLLLLFSTYFFADMGDGMQNVWNMWWVNKAVSELHQLPWHTGYLHYPHGISLIGSTLNPLNGFMGVLLLRFMTLVQAHNCIVVFSFVMGGVTAFWLAYYFNGSYGGSLLAGYIFTFSSYHFAHAEGHLQLVSLEWIPLFLLCWHRLLSRPGIIMAVLSGLVLFAVILCDYYYFLYCIIAAFMMLIWYSFKEKDVRYCFRQGRLIPMGTFVMTVLATAGPLVASLLLLNYRDPLQDVHNSVRCSMDLLAPFIPGGHWRFAGLTQWYWSRLPVNIHESSVYMGISVIVLLVYVWRRRREVRTESVHLWFLVLLVFAVMSLGPVLHIGGREVPYLRLPYALVESLFPPLKLSGVPVRMMVMVMLAASVLCAAGVKLLLQGKMKKKVVLMLTVVILAVEYLPRPLPASQPPLKGYVQVLQDLPDGGGIIDVLTKRTPALYYQTIHEKPVAFGYVARVPQSVRNKEKAVKQLIRDRDFKSLHTGWGFRYLVAGVQQEDVFTHPMLHLLYRDHEACVYELRD